MNIRIGIGFFAAIAAGGAAMAQPQGGAPGYYDLSDVEGWAAYGPSLTTSNPTWFALDQSGAVRATRSNCNISVTQSPFSEDEIVRDMLTTDGDAFAAELRSQGVDVVEAGPLVPFQLDGSVGVRYIGRARLGDIVATSISVIIAPNGVLITTTCTSLEQHFGADAPSLERFIDQVRYGGAVSAAKLDRDQDGAAAVPQLAASAGAPREAIASGIASAIEQALARAIEE
ncbi:MAG: hypothetical protein Tsb0010_11560 [Parvularculaceae bacterium]